MPVATAQDGVEIGWDAVGEGVPLVPVHGVAPDPTRHEVYGWHRAGST